MTEIWKDIDGYDGIYQVSSRGRVKSLPRKYTSPCTKILKPNLVKAKGVPVKLQVHLSKDGESKAFPISHLVLTHFVGARPGGHEACHNDGDLWNNCFDNLRWGTHLENIQDRVKHGTAPRGETSGINKLTEDQVLEIRSHLENGGIGAEMCRKFHVSKFAIYAIKYRKTWSHI